MMNTSSRAAGIFVRGNSLCLPCFSSSRSAVFVGAYDDDDAATLENGWWDFFFRSFFFFYWRIGNMGHKTCLRFPRQKNRKEGCGGAHLPCHSRSPLRQHASQGGICLHHKRAQTNSTGANAASGLACFSR